MSSPDGKTYGGVRGRVYTGPHAPESFIIPARDSKGESVRIWSHIQPGYDRAIAAIVNAHRFPFKTPGDVFRLAVHWALKHLEELEPVISVTGQVEAMLDVLRTEEAAIEFNEFLMRATAIINRHVREGAGNEARRIVADLRQKIQQMPPGYWRRKYLETVQEQFGHLIDGSKGAASLGRFGKDDEAEAEARAARLIDGGPH